MMHSISHSISLFFKALHRKAWQSEHGSISVETVIILPVVAWALMASFTFTDAFRHQTTLQKSVYTAADLVSRASGTALTPEYLNGVYSFMLRINDTPLDVHLRITLIGWDNAEEEYRVIWSYADQGNTATVLDDTVLNAAYGAQIPKISVGETLLLTEGLLKYEPPFRVGLQARDLTETALTRPRFAPGITFLDPNAPPPPEAWCEFVVDACGM